MQLASEDRQPPRKGVYLAPLQRLRRDCALSDPAAVRDAVEEIASPLLSARADRAPRAAAEAVLAADVHRGSDCAALAAAIGREVGGHLHGSRSLYSGVLRFAPPLTADLALVAIRRALLPGSVHVVYALKADSCQQAIFMGPALGRRYRNSGLGAFVELTSGAGVGHGRYDANRVDRARITPLGRVGGQPCT